MAIKKAKLRFSKSKEVREEEEKQERLTLAKQHGVPTPEDLKKKPHIGFLERAFDLLARGTMAQSSGLIEGVKEVKKNPFGLQNSFIKGFSRGAVSGITGKTKTSTEDVFKELGVGEGTLFTTPKVSLGPLTLGGKVTTRGLLSLPGDIASDPTTLLTLGTGTAAKVTLTQGLKSGTKQALKKGLKKGTEVTLNKGAGQKLLISESKRILKQSAEAGTELTGRQVNELAKKATAEIVSKNPNKYVDFGGIKFGGKTIAPQFQRKIGSVVSNVPVPFTGTTLSPATKKAFAALTSPINAGSRLKAAGFGEFHEAYQNIIRSPRNIARRTVEDTTQMFKKAYGKNPSQAQLDEFFTLADKGLPVDINNYKPQTPILTEIGQDLPEEFVKSVDNAALDEGTKTLYKEYLRFDRPLIRELALDMGLPEEKLLQDYIFRGVPEKTKKNLFKISNPFKEKNPASLKRRTAEEFTGERKDPMWAIAQVEADLRITKTNNDFLKETLKRYGTKAGKDIDIPEGHVEFRPKGSLGFFPVETTGGKMAAAITRNVPVYYVPKEIGNALNKFTTPKETNRFLQIYDKILNVQKIGLTSYYPAFHIRNFTGNVFNNWLGDVTNPKDYTDAALIQTGKLKGKIAGYSYKEIKTLIEDLGVVNTGFYKADIQELLERTVGAKSNLGKAKNITQTGLNIPTVIGSTIEDNAKIAHFISKIRSGLSPEEAAQSVKKFLFDYSELTDFEKGVMKRIFPFYTWTRKNIPLQLEQMVRQPGKYSALGKVIESLPKGEQGEIDLLPDYIKEGLFVKLGGSGKDVNYGYGINLLPVEDLNRLWRESPERFIEREILSFMNPALQFPLKQYSKRDFFYGKSYDEFQYDAGKQAKKALEGKPGGEALLKWLELKDESYTFKNGKDKDVEVVKFRVNPARWELLNTTPLSRLLNVLGADNPWNQAISPLKSREFDMEIEKEKRDREANKAFEQRLIDAGLLKTFTKNYIPKTEEEKEAEKESKFRLRFR
jgi:hypothetical protein